MANKLLLASAGAGKSVMIVKEALDLAESGARVLLLTYTINNQRELVRHICSINKVQPPNITVKGWFSFLLEDMVRPYQRCVVPQRISGILLNSANPHLIVRGGKSSFLHGRSEKIKGQFNPLHYVKEKDNRAHTYYLAKLAARINELTDGCPARRLTEIYNAVFIDEVQDLVGWDYALIRAIVDAGICECNCVGDFRQAVYQTSEAKKSPQTNLDKQKEFKSMGFEIDNGLAISWRCIQSICNLADKVHGEKDVLYKQTKSNVDIVPPEYADHQGIFAIPDRYVDEYIKKYNPVILRWNRQTKEFCNGRKVYNFGESKGLSFERVLLIKPPDKHAKFLSGETAAFDKDRTDDSRNKLYVGITRARYSVAFVHNGEKVVNDAQIWSPSK